MTIIENEQQISPENDMNGFIKKLPQYEMCRFGMIPPEDEIKLEDLALELAKKASGLASQLPLAVRKSVSNLVRTMNCYYSYLMDLSDIPPRLIDNYLRSPFEAEADPKNRWMRHASKAYIDVELIIDQGACPQFDTTSVGFLEWIDKEYHHKLPLELLPPQDLSKKFSFATPCQLRAVYLSGDQPYYQNRFAHSLGKNELSHVHEIATLGAAYHRLILTQPFYTCNKQAALLLTRASLKRYGVASSLWSVARGLRKNYRELNTLIQGEGQGAPTTLNLINLCESFLSICINEIDFMASLFEPRTLLYRMRKHIDEEVRVGNLLKGSYKIYAKPF